MNKADTLLNISTKIENGGSSTALEVREVLGTDTDSLLEVVYGESIEDRSSTQIKTIANSSANYRIKMFKNGNTVTIEGVSTIQQNSYNVLLFEISDSDFYGNGTGFAVDKVNNKTRPCLMTSFIGGNTQFKINGSLLAGQQYFYSITYNATN